WRMRVRATVEPAPVLVPVAVPAPAVSGDWPGGAGWYTSYVDSVHGFWYATITFADQLSEVGFGALLIAIGFQVGNLVLRATAWRNILIAALPGRRVRWRTVTGAYLAGAGVNAVVPARGGDVMKLFLVHRSVPESPYP